VQVGVHNQLWQKVVRRGIGIYRAWHGQVSGFGRQAPGPGLWASGLALGFQAQVLGLTVIASSSGAAGLDSAVNY